MSPKQKKLAGKAPPPNKLDEKDFAVLRAEKAKGRGMGLQDESVKPGKVMKAKRGKFLERRLTLGGLDAKKYMKSIGVFPTVSGSASKFKKRRLALQAAKKSGVGKIPLAGKATSVGSTTMKGMKFSDKAKMVDAGKINKATGKFTSMEALRESIGYRPGESTDKFNKRRMALAAAKKTASASRIGKIALGIGAAGVAASQYLKSKMNKKKDVKKKMGGGMMMQKPMGYKTGSGHYDEKNKNVAKHIRFEVVKKKMGGGMMKKPMGYKDGTKPGAGPLGGLKKAGRSMGVSALPPAGRPAAATPSQQRRMGRGAQGSRKKEISADNKRRIAYMDGAKETVTGGGMKADRFKEGLNIKGSKSSAMDFYARGDTDHGKLGQKKYKSLKNNTYSKGGAMKKGYMSGGMIKPMGYKSGTMVKARGCKLGRTRPTKIT